MCHALGAKSPVRLPVSFTPSERSTLLFAIGVLELCLPWSAVEARIIVGGCDTSITFFLHFCSQKNNSQSGHWPHSMQDSAITSTRGLLRTGQNAISWLLSNNLKSSSKLNGSRQKTLNMIPLPSSIDLNSQAIKLLPEQIYANNILKFTCPGEEC